MTEPLYRSGQLPLPGMIATWIEVHPDRILQLEEPSSVRNLSGPGLSRRSSIKAEIPLADLVSVEAGTGAGWISVGTADGEVRLRCQPKERDDVLAAIAAARTGEPGDAAATEEAEPE
jgi:hypothetical protein